MSAISLQKSKVLVTGGTGFIGSHIVARLLEEGCSVHVTTSSATGLYPYRLLGLRERITVHHANLVNPTVVLDVVTSVRPDLVIHLAAFTRVADAWHYDDQCMNVNLVGTINLTRALRATGELRRFVYVGTSEIYGRSKVPFKEDAEVKPASPYAISKYAAERYCIAISEAHSFPAVLVRPFNVYGPAQTPDRIVPEAIVCGLRRYPFRMTHGNQTRSFTYIDDVVDGLIRVASFSVDPGELYNLDSGNEISIRDLVLKLKVMIGGGLTVSMDAIPERPNEIMRMVGDATRARQELSWKPNVSLDEGLMRTISWYSEEGAKPVSPYLSLPPRLQV